MSSSKTTACSDSSTEGPALPAGDLYMDHHLVALTARSSRYQWLMILFLSAWWVTSFYISTSVSFVFMNPLFECEGKIVTEVEACKNLEKCSLVNSFTAVARNNLYCEKESERHLIQSSFWLGALMGVFFIPFLSEIKGRKVAFIISVCADFVSVILLIIGIWINSTILSIAGNLFIGIGCNGICTLSFILSSELFTHKLRQKGVMIFNASWPFGEMSFLLVSTFLYHWDEYLVYTMMIPILGLGLLSLFFLIETPYFELHKKKSFKDYKESIKLMALYNDVDAGPMLEEAELLRRAERRGQPKVEGKQNQETKFLDSMKMLFGSKRNIITVACVSLEIVGYNIYYYGVQCSMERFGFSYGFSMFFIGIFEFTAFFSASYILHKLPRKKGLMISVAISCILGMGFLLPVTSHSPLLQTILAGVSRISASYSYSFVLMLVTESFHPSITSNAITMSIGIGQTVNLMIPFLIGTIEDVGMQPIIGCSFIYLIVGLTPLAFIKETLSCGGPKQGKKEMLLQIEGIEFGEKIND